MHVTFEGSVICYVSLIKEKGSPGITSSCSGWIFKMEIWNSVDSLCSTARFWCPLLWERLLKRLKQTTTLLWKGEESSAAAAQEWPHYTFTFPTHTQKQRGNHPLCWLDIRKHYVAPREIRLPWRINKQQDSSSPEEQQNHESAMLLKREQRSFDIVLDQFYLICFSSSSHSNVFFHHRLRVQMNLKLDNGEQHWCTFRAIFNIWLHPVFMFTCSLDK